jgi:hypothetical protein
MLAGVCEILGVPMVGAYHKPMKWEDLTVIEALKDNDRFGKLVKRRNAQHDVWGFKYPGAWKFMPILKRHLRDPVYLAIFKEPVSVTQRRFHCVTLQKALNTVEQFRIAVDGMLATGEDIKLLSYHQAIIAPREFVSQVANLIGVKPTNGQIDCAIGFIQPGRGYLTPWT